MDLGGMENQRTAGQGPSWEKTGKRRYFPVLAAALLLSALCLFLWRQEGIAARAEWLSILETDSRRYVPRAAGEFSAVFNTYTEEWRRLSADIEKGIADNADGGYFVELTKRPFKDAKIRKVWIHLEPVAARGKEPFAVMRDSDGVESGTEMAYKNMQGDYYSDMSERSSLRFFMAMDKELVLEWNGAANSFRQENRLKLIVESPLLSGGAFAGYAGFEADIQDVYSHFSEGGMDMFLIDPDGTVAVTTGSWPAGEPYRDIQYKGVAEALSACAERAAREKTFGKLIAGSGDGEIFAAYTAVDAGAAGETWFVAGLAGTGNLADGTKWAIAIFFIWLLVLVGVLVIHETRKRRADRAAVSRLFAAMPPETAKIFKKLEFSRKACYVICALFCMPAIFALKFYEKGYRAAMQTADAEAAAKALSAMKRTAFVAVIIGCIALYLNIIYR